MKPVSTKSFPSDLGGGLNGKFPYSLYQLCRVRLGGPRASRPWSVDKPPTWFWRKRGKKQRKFWHASERCFEYFGDCRSWDGSSVEHFATICWLQHLHTLLSQHSLLLCWSSLFQTMWHLCFLMELIAKPFRGAISSYLFVSSCVKYTTRHLWPPKTYFSVVFVAMQVRLNQ